MPPHGRGGHEPLITTPNIADTDGFYASLLATHRGLSEAESQALNARLVLILANHIGDRKCWNWRLALAPRGGRPRPAAGAAAPGPVAVRWNTSRPSITMADSGPP